MHREAHEASNLRDAADRDWALVMSREITEMPDEERFLRMYHYPTRNWNNISER